MVLPEMPARDEAALRLSTVNVTQLPEIIWFSVILMSSSGVARMGEMTGVYRAPAVAERCLEARDPRQHLANSKTSEAVCIQCT